MKKIFIIYLFNRLREKWKGILFSVFFFGLIFAGLGYMRSSDSCFLSESQMTALEEYNQNLEEYNELVSQVEDSIETAEKQLNEQQKYCDNSVYMKLDSQRIAISGVQYAVNDNSNIGYILSALVTYINDGALRREMAEMTSAVSEEYLKEIITCSTNGNVMTVSVMHYDAEQAEQLMNSIDKLIENYKPEIANIQGDFRMEKLSIFNTTKADANIMNNQISNWNNLKNYQINLSDLQGILISKQANRQDFISKNKVEELSATKILKKYIFVGVGIGALLPLLFFGISLIIDDRLRSKTDLKKFGIPIIGYYFPGQENSSNLADSVQCILSFAQKYNSHKVFMCVLGEETVNKQIIKNYMEVIRGTGLELILGSAPIEDVNEMKQMLAANNCILVLEIGKTTYTQIDDYIQFCKKYDIMIWGGVVIETEK